MWNRKTRLGGNSLWVAVAKMCARLGSGVMEGSLRVYW